MPHIILSPEQLRVIAGACEAVEVRDADGRTVAHVTPLSPADREAIERSKQSRALGAPQVPSEQVQAHLARLEAIRQAEGLDEPRMLDLLRRLRAGEAV